MDTLAAPAQPGSGPSVPQADGILPGGPLAAPAKRFKVALSFPGEHRSYVAQVAGFLSDSLRQDRVLYDKYHEGEFARANLDAYLQGLYRDQSELVVVFLSKHYDEKQWCGVEWRALRDLLKDRQDASLLFLRFDMAKIPGLFSIDGYIWIGERTARDIADVILERAALPGGGREIPLPKPPSNLLHALLWGILFCGLIVLSTYFPWTVISRKFTLAALAIAAFSATRAGLLDLIGIPVKRNIQWAARQIQERPLPLGAFIGLLLTAICVKVGYVGKGVYERDRYSNLIQDSIEQKGLEKDKSLREAFAYLPWRRDAQVLLEERFWRLRTFRRTEPAVPSLAEDRKDNKDQYRKEMNNFYEFARPIIERLRSAPVPPESITGRPVSTQSDPLLWIASLIPEAGEYNETKWKQLAIDTFPPKKSATQELMIAMLELEIYQKNKSIVQNRLEFLKSIVEKEGPSLEDVFEYQLACDRIGQFALIAHKPNEAIYYFDKILNLRARRAESPDLGILWQRPPEKLMLFSMFGAVEPSLTKFAPELVKAKEFIAIDGFKELFLELIATYSLFKQIDAWDQGSLRDKRLTGGNVDNYVNDVMLKQGWRY
jgi:hypothetical protein